MNPYVNLHTRVTQTHQTHRTNQANKEAAKQANQQGTPPPAQSSTPRHPCPPKTGEKRTDKHAYMCTCMGKQQETQPKTDRQTCQDKGHATHTQTDIHLSKQTDGWRGGQADQPRLIDWFSDELTGRTAD